ncbi:hypothetical protein NPX13_g2722 [Xylaria arbuscula]|uniref:Uncharacterized protein n=1 Tax=Xylaria arbuscula TaxID=114810 RepID=A0A9W8NJP1_9PEZI|nr:hypothetical protein NPX13_g2722 [Xylaria arbuscula]
MSDDRDISPPPPHLCAMPDEMLLGISGCLTREEDASSLMKTCRRTYGIGKERFLQLLVENDDDGSAFRAAIARGITVIFDRMLHFHGHRLDVVFKCVENSPHDGGRMQAATLLTAAIAYNRPDFVDRLLQAGADVNFATPCYHEIHRNTHHTCPGQRHWQPIHWALGIEDERPNLDIVKSLLNYDVNTQSRTICPSSGGGSTRKPPYGHPPMFQSVTTKPLTLAVREPRVSEEILREILGAHRLKCDPVDFRYECFRAMDAFFAESRRRYYEKATHLVDFFENKMAKLQFMLASAIEGTIKAMGRIFRVMIREFYPNEEFVEFVRVYLRIMSQRGLLSDALDTRAEFGSTTLTEVVYGMSSVMLYRGHWNFYEKIVDMLMNAGASPDGPTKSVDAVGRSHYGTSPLAALCILPDLWEDSKDGAIFAGLFLSRGANLNHHDQYNMTPLHWTSHHIIKDAASFLLTEARSRSMNIINTRGCRRGWTALMVACREAKRAIFRDNVETLIGFIRLLLDNGADINATDDDNRNALHHLCYWPRRPRFPEKAAQPLRLMIEFLTRNGADASHRDSAGRTPMDYLDPVLNG